MIISSIAIAIILLILLIIIDFKLGRKDHLKKVRYLPHSITTGNYQLYKNGSPLYEDLCQDIANAKHNVDVFFYVINNDKAGKKLLEALKKKAEEGAEVRLLADRMGSYQINKKIRHDLRKAGVQFKFAETPGFPYFFYKLNRRNHRKISVIDGKIGYVGGYNVGRVYMGDSSMFQDWRDYHLRVTGPVVSDLQRTFLDDWGLATQENDKPFIRNRDGEHTVRIVATDGGELEDEYFEMIQNARQEIFIGTPYFIPTNMLLAALKEAIDRGVNIHVMIPMKPDHPLVKEAGLPYMYELARHGGNVSFFDAGFYHAKVMMVDRTFAYLGTANFDRRSLYLNKEVNMYIYEDEFVEDLRSAYLDDVRDSVRLDEEWIKNRPFSMKMKEQIAKVFRPLL
ncbi:cardiolipin synthase [Halobacillus sp. A1]|uniref:cardiolipin synthase n=1 Tax=Halobacillus sp. A1 TaxID=2880262 RepID=UPI0020A622C6|nr:cardiolipin synthase [Halobacillus sp. A1]MCP3033185.1 cardiolipin synthase [Halobacillus sp. A1]